MPKKWKDIVEKMPTERQSRIKKRSAQLRAEILALRDLRRSLNLTQEQLADAMNINQHSVSKMENQEDMYISTLQRIVHAMGGELKIVAKFPDREIEIDQFGLEP
jgi:transcriptional regulator with XRE-family HTH domain